MAQIRPYRGVEAAERVAQRRRRLLDAGLELLGSGSGSGGPELTVRAVCQRSGLGARYFYESFNDKDDLVAEVFDWVIADIAATTQAAVSAAPAEEQSRAGMANIVRTIAADARVGRLLFSTELSNSVIMAKRADSTALFATLLLQHAGSRQHRGTVRNPDDMLRAASYFAVGGVGQTISAWLSGAVSLGPDRLADHLASMLDTLSHPARRREA